MRRPLPPWLALALLVLAARSLEAQEPPLPEEGPSQVPRRLLVGDQGRLILNPGPGFEDLDPFVIDDPRQLPQGQDLKILRLELRRLRGVEWLFIDFTAFAPGRISLPPFDLPQMPGLKLESYQVELASILEADPGAAAERQGVLALSGPALPLAVPGTAFLIYGTASLIVLALLLSLGLGLWGRPYVAALLEDYRRRRLLWLMGRVGRRLRERALPGSCQDVLRELSAEFRSFLDYFWGGPSGERNCRAMTAAEFFALPPLFPPPDQADGAPPPAWLELSSPPALGNFFRLLDRLRYSGEPAGPAEVSALIDRLDRILAAMDAGFRAAGLRARLGLSAAPRRAEVL